MFRLFTIATVLSVLVLVVTAVFPADFSVQQWQAVEITLTSSKTYTDPFQDVDVTATFIGPDNITITCPAFCDGDLIWKVRFAPIQTGLWTMTTSATDATNSGLHNISQTVQCDAYSGNLDIYKHGFLKASSNGRYLTYADGTPFFYLGDTHWILLHERFDTSNVPGIASQFKYIVDKRVNQGFTVYQSEPLAGDQTGVDEEPVFLLRDGLTNADMEGFANFDRKFKYIADQGFVHANSQICWVDELRDLPIYTHEYKTRLAKYWVARYGAYPVIWTIAQECDWEVDDWGYSLAGWYTVGQSIADNDAYHHPIMPHMCHVGGRYNPANSWWAAKPYHTGWAVQWALGEMIDKSIAKSFWNYSPTKPAVMYETTYDYSSENYDEGTISGCANFGGLARAYNSIQFGFCGYGYGIYGIWNDLYSKPGEPHDWGCDYLNPEGAWWYDAAICPIGDMLTYFKNFYTSLEWWKLVPRFGDSVWGSFTDMSRSLLSSDEQNTYVVFFITVYSDDKSTGTLNNMAIGATYQAQWFNPMDGKYTNIGTFTQNSSQWVIPNRPIANDNWVLLVKKSDDTKTDGTDLQKSHSTLLSAAPNPSQGLTKITFGLQQSSRAEIKIVNSRGQLVEHLGSDLYSAGVHSVTWKASHKPDGFYFAILKVSGKTYKNKILLVK